MRGGTLSEKLALAATLLAVGCGGNHHVSPWGTAEGPRLDAFLRPPDLAAQLALVDAETAALRLRMTVELPFDLPPKGGGRKGALRGYEGVDVTGRMVHAVRAATPHGVVLALGPLEAGDLDRTTATELVVALASGDAGGGVAFSSGTDLNGDGSPDVVVKNDAGVLSIWRVGELGSGAYEITMAAPPTRGIDVDGDGRIDLWGRLPIEPGDPIAPRLADVATFAGGAYTDVSPAARAWHAREVPPRPSSKADDAVRARAAIERAWHAVLAGQPREGVLAELAGETVPRTLAASFEAHRRRVAAIVAH